MTLCYCIIIFILKLFYLTFNWNILKTDFHFDKDMCAIILPFAHFHLKMDG